MFDITMGSMSDRPRRTLLVIAVGAAYAALSAASALLINARTDLDISFWPSALVAAHGHPLHVYSIAGQADYPNANGPLSLVPLSLVAWIADRLGFAAQPLPRAALTLAVFSVFTLLLAYETARVVRHIRGDRPADRVPILAAAAVLAGPPLWLATTGFGHVEMPLQLWLLMLSMRLVLESRHAALAGFALGLALLTRSTTLLYLIPIGIFLVTAHRARSALTTLLTAFATAAVGIAPVLLADTSNVVHSLFTYRGALPINGGTVWFALRGSPIATLVQHGDVLIIALFVAAACILIQLTGSGARSDGARLLAMAAVAAAAFPMLAKTTLSYYMLEPYVFASAWALARREAPRTPALAVPVIVLLATLIADMGVDLPRVTSLVAQGVITSAVLALGIALAATLTVRTSPRREPLEPPPALPGATARRARAGSGSRL